MLQGEDLKERVIDDYRRSLVNAAFASRSYLELQDVDVLAAMITMVMQLVAESPCVSVKLSNWTVLEGTLSRSVRSGESLVGRCFDLSKAYKQIAVSKAVYNTQLSQSVGDPLPPTRLGCSRSPRAVPRQYNTNNVTHTRVPSHVVM